MDYLTSIWVFSAWWENPVREKKNLIFYVFQDNRSCCDIYFDSHSIWYLAKNIKTISSPNKPNPASQTGWFSHLIFCSYSQFISRQIFNVLPDLEKFENNFFDYKIRIFKQKTKIRQNTTHDEQNQCFHLRKQTKSFNFLKCFRQSHDKRRR